MDGDYGYLVTNMVYYMSTIYLRRELSWMVITGTWLPPWFTICLQVWVLGYHTD